MKEQDNCCGTTCDKIAIRKHIQKLEETSVDAMFEHFSDMINKTRCKVLSIESIKKWKESLEE